MKQRLSSTLHYLLLVLLFASACGGDDEKKQDDPTPKDGYLSATVEGTTYSRVASYQEWVLGSPTGAIDRIILEGTTAVGQVAENVQAIYQKGNGTPESAYVLTKIVHQLGANSTEYNSQLAGTITYTATGWSGTFSGVRLNAGGTVAGKIESGVFRNVKK